MRRFGLLLLLIGACSSHNDETLPLGEAARVRGLPFLRRPDVVTITRAAFVEESQKEITDDQVVYYRTVLGRLGYVPTDFDPRALAKLTSARVGAYYDPKEGNGRITTFDGDGDDDPALMIHELVHALQDQHFDLVALDESSHSTDERLAVRSLVEGDARVAEMRYRLEGAGFDPLADGARFINYEKAREESDGFLDGEGIPAYLSAYPSFAYTFGSVVVAKAIGLHDREPRWDTAGSDALFRAGALRSTEAVLRANLGIESDPIVEVGLVRLPEPLTEKYELRYADRLGAWLSWILLREAGELRSDIAMDWDGDQLAVIAPKDPAQPPVAVVWTSTWEHEVHAETVVDDLRRLHAAAAEPMLIERIGTLVVFAKGIVSDAELHALANAALYQRTSGERPSAARKTIDLTRFLDQRPTHTSTSPTCVSHRVVPPLR